MRLIIKGRNIELTPALKEYATEKLSKISKLFDQIIEVTAVLGVEKNPSISENQLAEVIVYLKKGRIQAKEASDNMYSSIDLLVDKVERQIVKHKTKLVQRIHSSETIRETDVSSDVSDEDAELKKLGDNIVKIDLIEEEVEA